MKWALLRFRETNGAESRRQHEVRRRLLDRLAPHFRGWQSGPGTAAPGAPGGGVTGMRLAREKSSGPGLMLNLAEALVNYCDEPGQLSRLAHAIWPRLYLYAAATEWRFFTEGSAAPGSASFCVELFEEVAA